MKAVTLALAACLVGPALASGPDTLWLRTIDLGSDERGYGIASRGKVIVVAGGKWVNVSNDILVVKMTQDGDTVWTRTFDGGSDDGAYSACMDNSGNVIVAGYGYLFRDGDRGGHRGLFDLVRRPPDAKQAELAFVVKYDSLGELQWSRTDPNHLLVGVTADTAGNCYVSGVSVDSSSYDLWLAKLNPSGDTVWTRTFDFAPIEIGYRVALDGSGNIITCAYVGDFSNFDCLTLKLTPSGDTIWTRRYDRTADDACLGIAVDPLGNVVVAGRTVKDSLGDALVLKYDSGGTLIWDRTYDFGADEGVMGAACDSTGDIYVTGFTGMYYVYDCLTLKLDSAGAMLWSATYGGSSDDEANDVACDTLGNPIIAGYVTDSITSGTDVLAAKYSSLTGVAEAPQASPAPRLAHGALIAAPEFVLAVEISGRYDVKLCDLAGRVRQQLFRGTLTKGAHRLSVSAIPAGAYFVRVAAPDGGISCQRLLLVK